MKRLCICVACGEDVVHYAKSMCQKCYRHMSYMNNRDVELARANEHNALHRDENRARSRRYSAEHAEENSIRNKDWTINNPRSRFFGRKYYLKTHDTPPKGYVWHHTCYDYSDPEANIVLLSRSSHAMGHKLLKMLNISIPCINMEND